MPYADPAAKRAYDQRPDVQAKRKAYFQRPDVKAASRARKERYRGTCEVCGAPTTGCKGWNAPTRCKHHNNIGTHKRRGTGPRNSAMLARLDGTTHLTEHCRALGISRSHGSNLLGRLMRYGLAERVAHGVYRRAD